MDSAGDLFIADTFNKCIREVSNGAITTVAGNEARASEETAVSPQTPKCTIPRSCRRFGWQCLYREHGEPSYPQSPKGCDYDCGGKRNRRISGDNGAAASAQLDAPFGIAVDGDNNLYIADTGNNRIRKVSNGVITTVAGGGQDFLGDNGPATHANLNQPHGIAVDAGGNLYIADTLNSRVREVSNGVITTIAGNGSVGFGGDNGPATAAALNGAYGVAVDLSGKVYIADTNNNRIRVLTPTGSLIVTSVVNAASNLIGAGLGPAQLISPSRQR